MSENHDYSGPFPDSSRLSLQADCENCFGLCCVALPFAASADFAIDKHAGQPCPNLQTDFRCSVHNSLRKQGFRGCTVYDCFGAGQKVAQATFGGLDWRQAPDSAKMMFEVFAIMRQLHELLWYLTEALTLPSARPIHGELSLALDETERLTNFTPDSLMELDVAAHRADVNALLLRTSELMRAEARRQQKDFPQRQKTYGRGADLIGANLRGADLTESIFLTQAQLNAAKGDADTILPPSLTRPTHWSSFGA
jgi:uncharacterized protein YjbI with pentapeptide repeats